MKNNQIGNKKNVFGKIITICLSMILSTGILNFTGCSNDDEKAVYTVSFETDGGTPVPPLQKVEEGSMATAPSTVPVKAGYVFVYWYSSGTTTAYNFQSPVNSNIILHAKWQEESNAEYWQVSWELNGGTWPSDDNHTMQVVKGGTLAGPNAPIKSGYTFGGWYKEVSLTNKIDFPYDVSTVTANITLYAKWTGSAGNSEIAMVSSGRYACFLLSAEGVLQAFGHNNYGQLGNGNKNDLENLTQIATGISAVYAGECNTFIIKSDGSLMGVGSNYGALGTGDDEKRSLFTPISEENVKTIAAGDTHTLLLKNDGSLWASGSNSSGELGVGDDIKRISFTPTGLTADVIAIAAGGNRSLAIKKDGTVWGAGSGNSGALGQNALNTENPDFVQIFSGATAIASNYAHSLILANDGTVYASGINQQGQLGTGNTVDTKQFTQATDDTGAIMSGVTAVAAGEHHSLALKADGTLWAAGWNNYGQLGTGDEENSDRFTKVASGVKGMSAGRFHSLILKNDGTTTVCGHVNPFDALNGSSTIVVKCNDTHTNRYITNFKVTDRNNTDLLHVNENLVTGGPGYQVSIKPGVYNLYFWLSHSPGVTYSFVDLAVSANETATVSYEYIGGMAGGYQWTVTRSKR